MEKNALIDKIKEAIDIVKDIDEPYRVSAFEVILQHLLLARESPYPFRTEGILHEKEDLVHFIRRKSPGTHNEKILVFGYFLEKFKGLPAFNASDIREAYNESRTGQPANVNDLLYKLQGEGLLIASDALEGMKAFRLSLSGLDRVEKLHNQAASIEK